MELNYDAIVLLATEIMDKTIHYRVVSTCVSYLLPKLTWATRSGNCTARSRPQWSRGSAPSRPWLSLESSPSPTSPWTRVDKRTNWRTLRVFQGVNVMRRTLDEATSKWGQLLFHHEMSRQSKSVTLLLGLERTFNLQKLNDKGKIVWIGQITSSALSRLVSATLEMCVQDQGDWRRCRNVYYARYWPKK